MDKLALDLWGEIEDFTTRPLEARHYDLTPAEAADALEAETARKQLIQQEQYKLG